jgi:hypothetical protein
VLDLHLSYEGLRREYVDDPELLASLKTAKDKLQPQYDTHYINNNTAGSQ